MKKNICLLCTCCLLISRMSCITLTDKEIAPENLERVITHEYSMPDFLIKTEILNFLYNYFADTDDVIEICTDNLITGHYLFPVNKGPPWYGADMVFSITISDNETVTTLTIRDVCIYDEKTKKTKSINKRYWGNFEQMIADEMTEFDYSMYYESP